MSNLPFSIVALIAGGVLIGTLSFFRVFWGLVRWEVRFDLRIVEFGIHLFLLGAICGAFVTVWVFRARLF